MFPWGFSSLPFPPFPFVSVPLSVCEEDPMHQEHSLPIVSGGFSPCCTLFPPLVVGAGFDGLPGVCAAPPPKPPKRTMGAPSRTMGSLPQTCFFRFFLCDVRRRIVLMDSTPLLSDPASRFWNSRCGSSPCCWSCPFTPLFRLCIQIPSNASLAPG